MSWAGKKGLKELTLWTATNHGCPARTGDSGGGQKPRGGVHNRRNKVSKKNDLENIFGTSRPRGERSINR